MELYLLVSIAFLFTARCHITVDLCMSIILNNNKIILEMILNVYSVK